MPGQSWPVGDRAGLGAASYRRVVPVLARARQERRTGTGVVDDESMARYVVSAASVSKPDCSAYERRIIALRFAGSLDHWDGGPPACGAFEWQGPDQAHQRRCWLACLDQCTGVPVREGHPSTTNRTVPATWSVWTSRSSGASGMTAYVPPLDMQKATGFRHSGVAYAYLHYAFDGSSRPAYSEIPNPEKRKTATASWRRATDFFSAPESPQGSVDR
jgi:hypothetical protein